MTRIVIDLERGPDGQPAGQLQASGPPMPFAGWLELVRLLEQELGAIGNADEQPPR